MIEYTVEQNEYIEKMRNDPIFRNIERNNHLAECEQIKKGYHFRVVESNLNSGMILEYYFEYNEQVKHVISKYGDNGNSWETFEENKHLKEKRCIIC